MDPLTFALSVSGGAMLVGIALSPIVAPLLDFDKYDKFFFDSESVSYIDTDEALVQTVEDSSEA